VDHSLQNASEARNRESKPEGRTRPRSMALKTRSYGSWGVSMQNGRMTAYTCLCFFGRHFWFGVVTVQQRA
jgi:hypothetical protein